MFGIAYALWLHFTFLTMRFVYSLHVFSVCIRATYSIARRILESLLHVCAWDAGPIAMCQHHRCIRRHCYSLCCSYYCYCCWYHCYYFAFTFYTHKSTHTRRCSASHKASQNFTFIICTALQTIFKL